MGVNISRAFKMLCIVSVLLASVLIFIINAEAQLSIDGVDISGLIKNQTKNKNQILDNQIRLLESRLSLKFSVVDFVKKGKFKLTLSDESALDPLNKTVKSNTTLDLPIELSEAVDSKTRFQFKSKFLPNNNVKDKIEGFLGTSFAFDMKPLKSNFDVNINSIIFPNETFKNQNDASVAFKVEGKQSKPSAKARLDLQYKLSSFPMDSGEDNTEFKFKTQGSGVIPLFGENELSLLTKYQATLKDKDLRYDPKGDFNGDGCPGICGVDDDGDGLIDEDKRNNEQSNPPLNPAFDPAFIADDDEDGIIDDTGNELKQVFNFESVFSSEEVFFLGDFDVKGNYDFQSAVKLDKKKDQSNTITQGIEFSSKRDFVSDSRLKTKLSFENISNLFPLSAVKDNRTFTQKFRIQVQWLDIDLLAERRDKEKTFPNEDVKNFDEAKELIELAFPIGENITSKLTLRNHREKHFPNNQVKDVVDDINAIEIKMKIRRVYQWKVKIELSHTTFPFDMLKPNEDKLKASASFEFNPLETFKVGLKFVTKISSGKDIKQDNTFDFTFDIGF